MADEPGTWTVVETDPFGARTFPDLFACGICGVVSADFGPEECPVCAMRGILVVIGQVAIAARPASDRVCALFDKFCESSPVAKVD